MAKDGSPKKPKHDATVRQQRLPLSWDETSAESPVPADPEAEDVAAETGLPTPKDSQAEAVGSGASAPVPGGKDAVAARPPPWEGEGEWGADEAPPPPVGEGGSTKQDRIRAREAAGKATAALSPLTEVSVVDDLPEAAPTAPGPARSVGVKVPPKPPSPVPVVLTDSDRGDGGLDSHHMSTADAHQPTSMTAGEMLLGARADFGYSVEDVATKTRIPRDVIDNLECCAINLLPSEYYCRTHIERLCALYNQDPEPILERFSAEVRAVRGTPTQSDRFHMARHESESGAMIRPMPEGSGPAGGRERSLSLTGILVSSVIVLFLAAAVWALVAQKLRNQQGPDDAVTTSAGELLPAVELKEFVVPMQLDAYELPIPDRPVAPRD